MGLNSGSVYVESNTSSWKKLDEFHDHEPCVPDPLLQSFILPENKIDRFPSLGQQLYKLLEIKESFSMWKSSIPTGFFFFVHKCGRRVKTIYNQILYNVVNILRFC